MKKYFTLAFLVVFIGLATGCGKDKVLECSMEDTNSTGTMSQVIKANFKGDEVTKVDLSIDMELEEKYIDYADTIIPSVENQFKDFEGKKGIKYSTDKTDKGFTFEFSADLTKMSDEDK